MNLATALSSHPSVAASHFSGPWIDHCRWHKTLVFLREFRCIDTRNKEISFSINQFINQHTNTNRTLCDNCTVVVLDGDSPSFFLPLPPQSLHLPLAFSRPGSDRFTLI
jgi:hypothetical protein